MRADRFISARLNVPTSIYTRPREPKASARAKLAGTLDALPPDPTLRIEPVEGVKNGRFKINFVSLEGMADKRPEVIKYIEQVKYDNGPSN